VEPDLCSACHDLGYNTLIKVKTGNTNIARARVGARVFTASSTMSGEQACLVVAQKAAAALRADSARIERYKHLSMFVSRAVLYLKFSAKAVPA
jgi:hypothetical protein